MTTMPGPVISLVNFIHWTDGTKLTKCWFSRTPRGHTVMWPVRARKENHVPNRVWVVAEYGEELHIEGDLLVLWSVESKQATLYRTLETYIEPSQGIIDKWHY